MTSWEVETSIKASESGDWKGERRDSVPGVMYATKRRQRNFKRVRETAKPGTASNPSKRHRERLNGELETVASLLPYDQTVICRLDKLSVLRLAVSYLQVKAHFQVSLQKQYVQYPYHYPTPYHPAAFGAMVLQTFSHDKIFSIDDAALKALGGFIVILNENAEIYYVTENIETYLGFHQSDILHQGLFDMIHSEDREEIRQQLTWNYGLPPQATITDLFTPEGRPFLDRNVNARFRCLLDNTCGFLRIDMRGKLVPLHGLPHSYLVGRADPSLGTVLGLVAVCTPFVPPGNIDGLETDNFLKTKHSLDLTLFSLDARARGLLELDEKALPLSFYTVVHCDDAPCLAEAHKEVTKNGSSGLLVYRLISAKSQRTYWVQSSYRQFYKNGKPESIGCTHRLLTEAEGTILLEKRASLSAKLLSFDDSLLQSPKLLQSTAALGPAQGPVTQTPVIYTPTTVPKVKKKAGRPASTTLASARNVQPVGQQTDVRPTHIQSQFEQKCLIALPQELTNLSGLTYIPQSGSSSETGGWNKQTYCNYLPTAPDFYYPGSYPQQPQTYYPTFQALGPPSNELPYCPSSASAVAGEFVQKSFLGSGDTGSAAGFNLISEVTNTLLGQ